MLRRLYCMGDCDFCALERGGKTYTSLATLPQGNGIQAELQRTLTESSPCGWRLSAPVPVLISALLTRVAPLLLLQPSDTRAPQAVVALFLPGRPHGSPGSALWWCAHARLCGTGQLMFVQSLGVAPIPFPLSCGPRTTSTNEKRCEHPATAHARTSAG